MANEQQIQRAQQVYGGMLQALDSIGWKYSRDDKALTVNYNVTGEDLTMEFYVTVDPGLQALRHVSILPVKFPEEKRLDAVIACCAANYGLMEGVFSCNMQNGSVAFVSGSSFLDCQVNKEWFLAMMRTAHSIVDSQNDRFFMLEKGMMTLEQFAKR